MSHSSRNMADRAADLTAVLLAAPTVESVSAVLRAHGERAPERSGAPGPGAGAPVVSVPVPDGSVASGPDGPVAPGPGPDAPATERGRPGPSGDLGLTAEDVAAMRVVAARLREVFAAAGVDEAAARLNRMLAEGARPPRLTTHHGRSTWHLHVDSHDDAPWAEWFLTSSAMALAVLLADHQRVPGGICAAGGCDRPFADSSAGSPRRFCSPRCATRARVAEHRARRTGAAPGDGTADDQPA
ncbi:MULTISPECIES: CGNR zinc finger domain-containing protein [Streptosporangium]|uniref:RNA-binding Zn ribbon-like protein n=1 Tax=Streptosporangium brasiliense TaxID=47480 RepID=A0ABT9RD77_9ACTN|nr:CGNR zinc finger domain-containing protein [Streptosporangium brasiliense]MDP9867206.1 putative RNA-binding Zn ribbon-like protein [Streptosporangium brasiliense]